MTDYYINYIPKQLPLPHGYTITRTEQWEWSLQTPDGDTYVAGGEHTLRVLAQGIEMDKSIWRQKRRKK